MTVQYNESGHWLISLSAVSLYLANDRLAWIQLHVIGNPSPPPKKKPLLLKTLQLIPPGIYWSFQGFILILSLKVVITNFVGGGINLISERGKISQLTCLEVDDIKEFWNWWRGMSLFPWPSIGTARTLDLERGTGCICMCVQWCTKGHGTYTFFTPHPSQIYFLGIFMTWTTTATTIMARKGAQTVNIFFYGIFFIYTQ